MRVKNCLLKLKQFCLLLYPLLIQASSDALPSFELPSCWKKKGFNFLCFSKYLFNIANLSQFRSTAFYQAVSSKHMYHLFFTHSHIASNYHRCISLQMQLRFDGTFGFPGGLMHRGEDVVTGLNREVSEEIGWDSTAHPITLKDYFSTQVIMLHHTTTILQLR